MSETIVRREFVEDPLVTTTTAAAQKLPTAAESHARAESHGPSEARLSINRSSIDRDSMSGRGFGPVGSESADGDDLDLVSAPFTL